jgi:hypothetical protein
MFFKYNMSLNITLRRSTDSRKGNILKREYILYFIGLDDQGMRKYQYEMYADITVNIDEGESIVRIMGEEFDERRWERLVNGGTKEDKYYFLSSSNGSVKCKYVDGLFRIIDKRKMSRDFTLSRMKVYSEDVRKSELEILPRLLKFEEDNLIDIAMREM